MRKIEQEMVQAMRAKKNWTKNNTSVSFDADFGAVVRLHGNRIAEITDETYITLFDGGYRSVTTKSRLNAIADEFNVRGVCQRAGVWYFDNGDEFESGIIQHVRN